jgi:hypothetical protein
MTEPIKWSDAPDSTSWGASMRVADIEIDKDHTLTLFCEADQTSKVDAMFAEIKRLRGEVKGLRKVARQTLETMERMTPDAVCDASHHSPSEYHSNFKPCPIEDQVRAAVANLRAALKETK